MPDLPAVDLHRTEYAELKDEQRTRMTTRDNLGYATWAGIGLVVAAGHTDLAATPALWLALPVVVVVLGWTRLQNDLKIDRIGQYIRYELAPRVSALVGEPVFGWEAAHNAAGTRWPLRMVCQLVADLALYTGAPVAALVAFWTADTTRWPLTVVGVFEALVVAGLAVMITLNAGFRPRGRDITGQAQTVSMPAATRNEVA